MYKNITVCLDLSDKDETLIAFAIYLKELYTPKSLTLLHGAHLSYLPETIKRKYMTDVAVAKLKTRIRAEIAGKVDSIQDFYPHITILDGSPREEILEWVNTHDSDLVVVGKGSDTHASCALAKKLTRECEASVLIVPQNAKAKFSKLLCPVDFSIDADDAITVACEIGRAAHASFIEIFHLYYHPIYQYGEDMTLNYNFEWNYGTFNSELAEYSEEQLQQRRERSDLRESGMRISTKVEGGFDIPLAIECRATECEADLCVIGQCDRSGLDAFFLGNNAETLMHTLDVPLLVVGEKFHKLT
ncbi:MAG: universal stress protein [Opitutaceae bacterium]